MCAALLDGRPVQGLENGGDAVSDAGMSEETVSGVVDARSIEDGIAVV